MTTTESPTVSPNERLTAGESGQRASLERLSAAAARKGVHTRTIRRRIADGSIRGYRFGPRLIMVDPNEVDTALLRQIAPGEQS